MVVVFAAGLLLGMAADNTNLTAGPAEETAEAQSDADEDPRRGSPMYEQVEPTEAQMALIDSIVAHHQASMKELNAEFREVREGFGARYRSLITETREAIKGVLDPARTARYDSLLAEYDSLRAEHERRRDEGRSRQDP